MFYSQISSENNTENCNGTERCPSCHGTGRISQDDQERLVALIPYTDDRLKPSRTKLYVFISVLICCVGFGLGIFFLWPRSVYMQSISVVSSNATVNLNKSETSINILMNFNVTNTNYFKVVLSALDVDVSFDKNHVGQGSLLHVPVNLQPKMTQNFAFPILTSFNKTNKLDKLASYCSTLGHSHSVVLIFSAKLRSLYLSHSEESTTTIYKFIDCSVNKKY